MYFVILVPHPGILSSNSDNKIPTQVTPGVHFLSLTWIDLFHAYLHCRPFLDSPFLALTKTFTFYNAYLYRHPSSCLPVALSRSYLYRCPSTWRCVNNGDGKQEKWRIKDSVESEGKRSIIIINEPRNNNGWLIFAWSYLVICLVTRGVHFLTLTCIVVLPSVYLCRCLSSWRCADVGDGKQPKCRITDN